GDGVRLSESQRTRRTRVPSCLQLAREADTPRLRCADPADLGTRESVWPIRSRHEYAIGVAVIEMAPGDTTVGSTPTTWRNCCRIPIGSRRQSHFTGKGCESSLSLAIARGTNIHTSAQPLIT